MNATEPQYKVHQCFFCLGNGEYFCESCPSNLCSHCKVKHVENLKTIDHNVMTYREKFNHIPKEICVTHPGNVYKNFCKRCKLPVCYQCRKRSSKHRKHRQQYIETAYKTKQQQFRGIIHTIRSDALFYRPILLSEIKADFNATLTNVSLFQSKMLAKAKRLKNLIDFLIKDLMGNVFCHYDLKHRCLKQKIEMIRHIICIQKNEHRQEQSVDSALRFLLVTKRPRLPQIYLTLHTSQLSMTEAFNKEDVMESLYGIQIKERGERGIRNEHLLIQMSDTELHHSLTVTGVNCCHHMSCVTSDRVWVSDDDENLMLTNRSGEILHHLKDLYNSNDRGLHTVNSEGEVIYIDKKPNISKISKDMKTITTYIETSHNTWSPQCVYYSHSTGDLLIGMSTGIKRNEILTWDYKVVEHYSVVPKKGKVNRYNQTGQLTQTIQHGNKKSKLYNTPIFLTENNNGDVVVSNFKLSLNDQYEEHGSIVVTDSKGRHRFSYTRHPSGIVLRPRGICTDALSHILVCDKSMYTVQIIDKNGQFLSHLLTRPSGIFFPQSLAYDINTHRLWVGSKENNTVCVYMYIARQTGFTYQNQGTLEVREPPNETSTTENSGKVNDHLWKLISPPKLFQSLEISKAYLSLHISCVTPDQVWASNNNDLILTNIKGETLYYLKDSCSGLGTGRHTVNSESELIYVDMKYNIKILSKNMKTITTFIDRADSPWIPLCVYWCPSTGDLLVGFEREVTKYRGMGKVTRYSRTGQPTQTIEHDSAGLNLYRKPYYITENNNEDIVVSDCKNAVVVTTFGGIHRFSYTGHPSGTGVVSQGICTDPMSHILVCDGRINKIHIIDKDGQFLSHLKISYPDSIRPWSLSYDVNTHLLWIKSFLGGIVGVYRYMDRQDALTNDVPLCPDEDISLSWGPV